MKVLTFNGKVVSGTLDLDTSQMVSVPAKRHYDSVTVAFRNQNSNIGVVDIECQWLDYDNKVLLGSEIEKRWNQNSELERLRRVEEAAKFLVKADDDPNGNATGAVKDGFEMLKTALITGEGK